MLESVTLATIKECKSPDITVYRGLSSEVEEHLLSLDNCFVLSDLPNPTQAETSEIIQITNNKSVKDCVASCISATERVANLVERFEQCVEILRSWGKNDTVINNVCLKFYCWLKYRACDAVNNLNIKELQYYGNLSTHVIMFFYIILGVGVNISVITASTPDTKYFADIQAKCVDAGNNTVGDISSLYAKVKVKSERKPVGINVWLKGKEGVNEILTPYIDRKVEGTPVKSALIKVNGVENKSVYTQELYELYMKVNAATTLINSDFQAITPNDINMLRVSKCDNYVLYVKSLVSELRLEKAAFDILVTELLAITENLGKKAEKALLSLVFNLKNVVTSQSYSDRRYLFFLETIPLTWEQAQTFYLLSCLMYDVVVFNPNNIVSEVEIPKVYEINYGNTMEVAEFPVSRQSIVIATTAYNAEAEMTKMLYNANVGVFRDNQFKQAGIAYLKPMQEEIDILWDKPLNMRQGFNVTNEYVTMPVIFAELLGVKDEDTEQWCQRLDTFIEDTSSVFYNYEKPILSDDIDWSFLNLTFNVPYPLHSAEVIRERKIDVELMFGADAYPTEYTYLSKGTQLYLIDKLQELLDSQTLKGVYTSGTENIIFNMWLKLSQNTKLISMLRNFDFTKENPKVVYTWFEKAKVPQLDVILLHYLNLLGFDVLIFVPTGYNVLDAFVNKQTFVEYQTGSAVEPFEVKHGLKKPLFNKFFRRKAK